MRRIHVSCKSHYWLSFLTTTCTVHSWINHRMPLTYTHFSNQRDFFYTYYFGFFACNTRLDVNPLERISQHVNLNCQVSLGLQYHPNHRPRHSPLFDSNNNEHSHDDLDNGYLNRPSRQQKPKFVDEKKEHTNKEKDQKTNMTNKTQSSSISRNYTRSRKDIRFPLQENIGTEEEEDDEEEKIEEDSDGLSMDFDDSDNIEDENMFFPSEKFQIANSAWAIDDDDNKSYRKQAKQTASKHTKVNDRYTTSNNPRMKSITTTTYSKNDDFKTDSFLKSNTFIQDKSSLDDDNNDLVNDEEEDAYMDSPFTSKTSSSSTSSTSTTSLPQKNLLYNTPLDDTQRKLQEQQRQIDFLMAMVKNSGGGSGTSPSIANQDQDIIRSRSSSSTSSTLSNRISNHSDFLPSYSLQQQQQQSSRNSVPSSWSTPYDIPYLNEMGENELMEEDESSSDESRISIPFMSSSRLQQRRDPSSSSTTASTGRISQSLAQDPRTLISMAPLKAMLFIDGTWLYYSLHRRSKDNCPIIKKYGLGWQYNYKVDWSALPRVLCDELVRQESTKAWSSTASNTVSSSLYNHQRSVEIVRASVFTSYFKTTDPLSFRVRMYDDMRDANYDIHQMETIGPGEKCVDIQLAVEMLHYATVTNAYDIAILLSGDKDFIPAMVRTRQKGRKVAVVSMRAGCNRALCESPHIKDYDVVWIDELLDQLIVPINEKSHHAVEKKGLLSIFTVSKVLYDFIINSPTEMVSSRDVGRYLKGININESITILEDLKNGIGGLSRLVSDEAPSVFEVRQRSIDESRLLDPRDKSYLIGLKPDASKELEDMIMKTEFTPEEKIFLRKYWANESRVEPNEDNHPLQDEKISHKQTPALVLIDEEVAKLERKQNIDYSALTVAVLKEMCRERKLAVTGKKLELIERLTSFIDMETEKNTKTDTIQHSQLKYSTDSRSRSRRSSSVVAIECNPLVSSYLEGLIKEYLVANGGMATSNNIGRYLNSSNPSGHSISKGGKSVSSALSELKEIFGSLATFINMKDDLFEISENLPENNDAASVFSFTIKLRHDLNTLEDN